MFPKLLFLQIPFQPQHQEKCAQVAAQLQALASKAEEMQLDKIFVRVFRPDRSTKAMLIDRSMRVGQLCDIMTEKNFLSPSTRLSLVERVFSMKMGTCGEAMPKLLAIDAYTVMVVISRHLILRLKL